MNKQIIKLTYVEIDKLLEPIEKDWLKELKLKFVTDEEIESLLKTP
ncbi:hypothetical protein [Litchfieldia salsa]|nr:hypothetical protein [Litchfieldia salsa]